VSLLARFFDLFQRRSGKKHVSGPHGLHIFNISFASLIIFFHLDMHDTPYFPAVVCQQPALLDVCLQLSLLPFVFLQLSLVTDYKCVALL
jgi:hypothetical protein